MPFFSGERKHPRGTDKDRDESRHYKHYISLDWELRNVLDKPWFNKRLLEEVLVFCVLTTIGVVGRWGQPDWCFTPTAAVGVFAGFYFSRLWMATLVPMAVLGISDLALPAYDSRGVMVAVHVALLFPVALGWSLRRPSGKLAALGKFAACGMLPAILFFVLSNWAVWQFTNTYEPTLAGLAASYAAAVPFFRAMLVGDVFYLTMIFGCYVLAMNYLRRPVLQPVEARLNRKAR